MNELRWILIGFGIVLLAGIYLWGRRGAAAVGSGRVASPRPQAAPPLLEPETRVEMGIRPFAEPDLPRASVLGPQESLRSGEPQAGQPALHAASEPQTAQHAQVAPDDSWRGRLEPTFSDAAPTQELPVRPDAPAAPTLSSSESPVPRRIERRKILSLRLCFSPHRVQGEKLLESLLAESLQHGKYSVFHRLHGDGTAIFSVASMVEPGTFELEKMAETLYPGITLFAQLPGPVPGMHALNELVACARRLQQSLGGTLQDERGVPLTVHRIERMRQEVREFERPPAGTGRGGPAAQSAHP